MGKCEACRGIFVVYCSRYLISKGAIVDKIGGDLKSTPLHWATRYIIVIIEAIHGKNGNGKNNHGKNDHGKNGKLGNC